MKTGISVAEARQIVLEAAPLLGAERVALPEAEGRVLAEPVVSARTLPPADCSAMDGYALRAVGTPAVLHIAYELPAGRTAPRPLGSGEAARIFTGAALPPGADTVVPQEAAEARDGQLLLRSMPFPGDHVRPAGEDVRAGETVLEPGTCLGPAHLGMLASLGRSFVAVHQRPRVALLSGGDELVEPDGDVSGGRVVASNAYSLAGQCREVGAVPLHLGIARDTPADLERLLRAGLGADLLVSSAGVSVGDHDHVRPVLEKLGCRLVFWGVRMKPGHPLAFGRLEDAAGPLVFGLPGNPVSAMVCFEQFVRPLIRKMTGHRAWFRPCVEALLDEVLDKQPGRLHFVRVMLERRDGELLARSTGTQSSGALRSMTRAHGLLVFPAEATRLAAGARVRVQVTDPEFFASEVAEP